MGFFGPSKPVKAQRKGLDGKYRKKKSPLREEAVCDIVLPMDITCNVSVSDDWSDVSMPSESGKKKKGFIQRIFSRKSSGYFANKRGTDYLMALPYNLPPRRLEHSCSRNMLGKTLRLTIRQSFPVV